MYFSDEIELGNVTAIQNEEGFPAGIAFTPAKTVFSDRRSVSRASFYAASTAGKALKCVFAVHMEDYSDETAVRYNGHVYDVVRSYQKTGTDVVELECSDESAAQ